MKTLYAAVFVLTIILLFLFSGVINVSAHGKEKHAAPGGGSEMTYTKDIKKIFKNKCSKCHGSQSPEHMEFMRDMNTYKKKKKGPRMDTHAHMVSFIIWPDTGSLMRALDDGKNTTDGRAGRMYQHLGKSETERQKNLQIFREWVGNWTLKEWADIKKEEIDRMKLLY